MTVKNHLVPIFYATHAQSVHSFADYIDYDREGGASDPMLGGGFQSLLSHLSQRLEGRVDICLNTSLTSVDWASAPLRLAAVKHSCSEVGPEGGAHKSSFY